MLILQFQCTEFCEKELQLVPEFCEFLIQNISSKLGNKIIRKKIDLRLKYIQEKVDWIQWDKSKKYETTASDLIRAVVDSLVAVPYKDNVWKIETDLNTLIPNSYTPVERFIRFLNYGDNTVKATGIFTKLENEFDHNRIMKLWRFYYFSKYGEMPQMTIIAK